jgi:putative endonuclease
MPAHYVYLVRCADGSFYCGYAVDVVKRIQAHNAGKGSKILRGKLPVRLAYARKFRAKSDALRHEIALKRQSHADKGDLARAWRKRARR